MIHRILITLTFSLLAAPVFAAPVQLDSGERQVQLIELYTSQGCSSCPPADDWLSDLQKSPGLWTRQVPVAFHVDYWDYIGWTDPFARGEFSRRQTLHRSQGNTSGVYTPGFLVDGREWRGFFSRGSLPEAGGTIGRLTAAIDNGRFSANFKDAKEGLRLHVAVLGMGLLTDVKRGENRGRQLKNDFSVLHYQVHSSSDGRWDESLTGLKLPKAERYAIAFWVTPAESLKPLQATGGWLPLGVLTR